jgi:hypothetical protein
MALRRHTDQMTQTVETRLIPRQYAAKVRFRLANRRICPDGAFDVISDVVGVEVRRRREAAGLTRDQFAERCAELGWPALTSTVLHYIETGRRDANGQRRREVTIDEVVGLAYILGTSPMMLLAPLDDPEWRGLPGGPATTAAAVAWLRGDRPLFNNSGGPEYRRLQLFVRADARAQEIYNLLGEVTSASGGNSDEDPPPPPGWQARFEAKLEEFRTLRAQLRDVGQLPPALPPAMQWLDSAEAGADHG